MIVKKRQLHFFSTKSRRHIDIKKVAYQQSILKTQYNI
jgi:hypothetical protein